MEHREDDKARRAKPGSDAPRKPYESPRLRVYGNVAALTRTIGNMSMKADGGGGMNSKTG
jgi:hypothetical protein